ncbi:MAG: metal-dependent hydrolase [Saprospiraceae bacterium]|nr:metal-dependent hydrolase [Saprospiraceae bacterium]
MASIFGHVAASTALGHTFFPDFTKKPGLLLIAGFCSFAPDLDVLAFRFGVSYASQWGHRGWTHSICFAIVFGALIAVVYDYLTNKGKPTIKTTLFLILCTLSHPLLDMLTNGGRGCALWWPISQERIFFPFRPIQVSPMGISDFFTPWGMRVIVSEIWWIGLPAVAVVLIARLRRNK